MERDLRKDYIKRLLASKRMEIPQKQADFFDRFVDDAEILNHYQSINNAARNIMDTWKERSVIEDIRTKHIQLPNATVGKPYSFEFSLAKMGLQHIEEFEIDGFSELGLNFDKATGILSGAPGMKGEHKIKFRYKLDFGAEERSFHEKELTFVVNPDPKSLWQNLPSDKEDKFWKEDNTSAKYEIAGRHLVVGSKRGRSHAHEGKFRDDEYDFFFDESTGFGVIVVSDGAGSAKYSRKGSLIACESVVEYFSKEIPAEEYAALDATIISHHQAKTDESSKTLREFLVSRLAKAAFYAHQKIKTCADENESALRDFSATLLYSLVRKYDFGYCIMSFGIGDGGIGIYDKEKGESHLLTTPDGGEFAGQTRFVTMPDIFTSEGFYNRVSFKIVDNFTALVLMSDGITDPKFQTDANLGRVEKWAELWEDLGGKNADNATVKFDPANENIEAELLDWMDFWSPGNHDDRTIAILY
ncbi:MAG: hypothetical protein FD123_2066 [Bacteroidetes bacterium]|nr:MAG: hypothetical protein FD123_2066 [Bacteroidota bacterium]